MRNVFAWIFVLFVLVGSVSAFGVDDWISIEAYPLVDDDSWFENLIEWVLGSDDWTFDKECLGVSAPSPFLLGLDYDRKYCATRFNLTNPTDGVVVLRGDTPSNVLKAGVWRDSVFVNPSSYVIYERGWREELVCFEWDCPVPEYNTELGCSCLNESLVDTLDSVWKVSQGNTNLLSGQTKEFLIFGEKRPFETLKWELNLTVDGVLYYVDPFWNGSVGESDKSALVREGLGFCDDFENDTSVCSHVYRYFSGQLYDYEQTVHYDANFDMIASPEVSNVHFKEGGNSLRFFMNGSAGVIGRGYGSNRTSRQVDVSMITGTNTGCTDLQGSFGLWLYVANLSHMNCTQGGTGCVGNSDQGDFRVRFGNSAVGAATNSLIKVFYVENLSGDGWNYVNFSLADYDSCSAGIDWRKINYTNWEIGTSENPDNFSVWLDDLRFYNNSGLGGNWIPISGVWNWVNDSGDFVLAQQNTTTVNDPVLIRLNSSIKPVNSTVHFCAEVVTGTKFEHGVSFNTSRVDGKCSVLLQDFSSGRIQFEDAGHFVTNTSPSIGAGDRICVKAEINDTFINVYYSTDGNTYIHAINTTFGSECNEDFGLQTEINSGGSEDTWWKFDNFVVQQFVSNQSVRDTFDGWVYDNENLSVSYLFSSWENENEELNTTVAWWINGTNAFNYTTVNPTAGSFNGTLWHILFAPEGNVSANVTSCDEDGCNTTSTQLVQIRTSDYMPVARWNVTSVVPQIGTVVNFTVNITDVEGIDNVSVDVFRGGVVVESFANASFVGSVWNVTFTPFDLGDYVVVSTGTDTNGNTASTNFSFSPANTTLSFAGNVNETLLTEFLIELSWNVTDADLWWNGSWYDGVELVSGVNFSWFAVNITVPLVDGNTSAFFYWNYTAPNGTYHNESNTSQSVQMAYYINLREDFLNASYMETEVFKAKYNMTNFSNKADVSHSFVSRGDSYGALFNGSVSNITQNYVSELITPNASSATMNLAGVLNVSFGGVSSIRTSNFSVGVDKALIFLCENAANTTTLRFFVENEDNQTPLSVSSFEVNFDIWVTNASRQVTINYTNSSSLNNFSFCLGTNKTIFVDAYVKYKSKFVHKFFLLNESINDTAKNFTLYNFPLTTALVSATTNTTYPSTTTTTVTQVVFNDSANYSTSQTTTTTSYSVESTSTSEQSALSSLKVTARDKATYNPIPNVITKLQRWYVGENTWRDVQMDKSGDFGLLFYNVYEKTTDYKFVFLDESGCVIKTTNNLKFGCVGGLCDVTYVLEPSCVDAAIDNLSISIAYDNVSSNVSVDWANPAGGDNEVHTIVSKETMTGNVLICNQTQSGANGFVDCPVGGYTGLLFVGVESSTNGIKNEPVADFVDITGTKLGHLVGNDEGAFWAFGIALTCAIFGVIISPVAGVIAVVFGLVIIYMLGIFTLLTFSFVVVVGVIGVAIGVKIRT